ncbi:hypothetical protein O181_049674 [Austropuccinia psidii MF-1]|uniref:Uncharacterized protein n=1 Tax=Austropuccinia psidii MF-1 TaxID=1389203 RepID=A0A9Q3DVA2_9BASI|nr:hypothetical protein [Austropuccinia psidii MF-1]
MHSNPEDGPEASYGPNRSPKTFPERVGKVRFYGPGPSQWAQAKKVRIWSMDPLDSQNVGQFWPWGALVTPTDCRTPKRQKDPEDQKTQKRPKRAPIMICSKMAIVMARTQIAQEGPKWLKSSFRPIFKEIGDNPPP